ncbi:glutathione S-transferase family protein [Pyxidicoccus fallax]|uniref:Glutathione S-transferase family protein n=1 Tax=Pyxidicoccus fallax TaxID=394095 RepID=A0A848LF42_9BACT|nr:glutathione S-transferase family protein [Pyxidicoccus fallax]NMO15485.1 glutathione S-transferase family protein [Pyxidicoccus fallax]NPC80327.1 glutathione S-transferase family protein [Pyxidicoccus fallax]
MITLYHCMSARSFRPLWTLEELGLTYELKMLPFPPRVRSKEFLELNRLGTVPLFTDGDTRMTESAAITQYLVTRYGGTSLAVAPEEKDYGAYLNWLHFGEATLTFPQTLVLRYGRFEPPERRQPQVVEDYSRWFLARLRGIDSVLTTQPHLCGERFTAADVSVGYALMLAGYLGMEEALPAAVQAYWRRLAQRPAYQKALAAQHQAALEQGVSTVPAPLVE